MGVAKSVAFSEDMPGREEAREAPLIRLSRIFPNPDQPRKMFVNQTIIELADSIQEDGQRTPVEVCTYPGRSGSFMLIAGERRHRALHLVWERTGKEPLVKAFVEVVKDMKDVYRRAVVENLHREDMCSLDTAAAYCQLRKDGNSVADIAEMAKKSVTHIENYMKLVTLPDEVKVMMDPNLPKERQLVVTSAIDIARGIPAEAHDLRTQIAREALERQLGVMETRALVEHTAIRKGFATGGSERDRKPSDEYGLFLSFLGRLDKNLVQMTRLDFTSMYRHRALDDQTNDTARLDTLIRKLELLRDKVKKA